MSEVHELFAASVGAAAALIGLLFVAISIAPEKVFGAQAEIERRIDAQRAFTALTNVFFVSLAALMPRSALISIVVVAVLAMLQTVRTGVRVFRHEGGFRSWNQLGIMSFCIYAFEAETARRLTVDASSAEALVYVAFGLYGYALATAWSLLGAKTAR